MNKIFNKTLKSKKFWKWVIILLIILPIILFSALVGLAYWKQDEIVQHLIEDINKDFKGLIEIKGSHISPFEAFPYISIDLEEVKVFESKSKINTPLVDVHDIYLGFDIWTIISGKMEVKEIKLKKGKLSLVQHLDGTFNIANALSPQKKVENPNEEFHLDLHEIVLEDIDITKLNEANNIVIDAYVYNADAIFSTSPHHVFTSLESKFELNLILDGDTSFIKHKHFELDTELDFITDNNLLTIKPTMVKLEGTDFNMEGTLNLGNDGLIDMHFDGKKENFELLIAMAPEELIPTLKKYDNKGSIYFDATLKGKTMNGYTPAIEATFGCEHAYFNNKEVNKKLDDLTFVGHFTNGENAP